MAFTSSYLTLLVLLLSCTNASGARVKMQERSVLSNDVGNSTVDYADVDEDDYADVDEWKALNSTEQYSEHYTTCADYADVDQWKNPDSDWCYIRVYRCDDRINAGDLKNKNAGDASWAASDKGLSCGHYGTYLKVYQISVKKALLDPNVKSKYRQCNRGRCGSNTKSRSEYQPFGWRYKSAEKAPPRGKKQFTLPKGSHGQDWNIHCLEKIVPVDCLKKYTWVNPDVVDAKGKPAKRDNSDAVAMFKQVVFQNIKPECKRIEGHGIHYNCH